MNADLFVNNVQIFCDAQGIKKTTACAESGAGKSLISEIRRGHRPSDARIQKLARFLGTSPDVLMCAENLNLDAPTDYLAHRGVFSNWSEIRANSWSVFERIRQDIPEALCVESFDADRYLIAALDILFNYGGDELKLARWIDYNISSIVIPEGDFSPQDISIEYAHGFKNRLFKFYWEKGQIGNDREQALEVIDDMLAKSNSKAPQRIKKEPDGQKAAELPDLDRELISLLCQLTPEDIPRVKDFVAGLIAARGE